MIEKINSFLTWDDPSGLGHSIDQACAHLIVGHPLLRGQVDTPGVALVGL